jgi:hypothetical protein
MVAQPAAWGACTQANGDASRVLSIAEQILGPDITSRAASRPGMVIELANGHPEGGYDPEAPRGHPARAGASGPQPRMPVVWAVRSGALLAFRCDWCRAHHWHGGPGHRTAHCTEPASPFKATGYKIVEVSPARLLWPGQGRQAVARQVPPALAAECEALGLDGRQARRLWAAALDGLGGAR